jgi:hypothetical protein
MNVIIIMKCLKNGIFYIEKEYIHRKVAVRGIRRFVVLTNEKLVLRNNKNQVKEKTIIFTEKVTEDLVG